MKNSLTASDMMTKKLVTLSPDMDIFDAIDVLLKHRISGAPVVDAVGRFLGVFSERNCMEFVVTSAYEQLPGVCVMLFVDQDPITISPDADLLNVVQTFVDSSMRRLPVIDQGQLVGQISRRDVMKAIIDQQRCAPIAHRSELLYFSAVHDTDADFRAKITK